MQEAFHCWNSHNNAILLRSCDKISKTLSRDIAQFLHNVIFPRCEYIENISCRIKIIMLYNVHNDIARYRLMHNSTLSAANCINIDIQITNTEIRLCRKTLCGRSWESKSNKNSWISCLVKWIKFAKETIIWLVLHLGLAMLGLYHFLIVAAIMIALIHTHKWILLGLIRNKFPFYPC